MAVPLRAGLGQDPWRWLKDGTGWVDFRALTGWGGRQSPDVEFETTEDPVAELTALASQGESTFLEYKQELPDDTQASKRKVLKTVVAFANGDGGTMPFGVDGDDVTGAVLGLVGRPAVLLRRLNSLVRDRVTPAPSFTLSGQDLDGKYIIRLEVTSGGGSLYALSTQITRSTKSVATGLLTAHGQKSWLKWLPDEHRGHPYGLRSLVQTSASRYELFELWSPNSRVHAGKPYPTTEELVAAYLAG